MRILIILILLLVVFLAGGCFQAGSPARDRYFPRVNQDPALGVLVNHGTAHLNVFIYDRAGRLVKQVYLQGTSRIVEINGRRPWQAVFPRLDVGEYKVVVQPFFRSWSLLYGERAIWLDRATFGLVVPRTAEKLWKGRFYGWVLEFHVDAPPAGNPINLVVGIDYGRRW